MSSEADVYEIVTRLSDKLGMKPPAITFGEKGHFGIAMPAFLMSGTLTVHPGLADRVDRRQLEVCLAFALVSQVAAKRFKLILTSFSSVAGVSLAILYIAAFEFDRRQYIAPFWTGLAVVAVCTIGLSFGMSFRLADKAMVEVLRLTNDPEAIREHYANSGYVLKGGKPLHPSPFLLRKRLEALDRQVTTSTKSVL